MAREVYASSERDTWATPQPLFDQLDAEFGFDIDLCALPCNTKCDRYYTQADDSLAQEWRGTCWMNPPYGRGIGDWICKAFQSSLFGATVVCLVPARTDFFNAHGCLSLLVVDRSSYSHGSSNDSINISMCSLA
jgi:phage N-6-adenine-methyltransferase